MQVHAKLSKGGRVIIPRNFRKALNLNEGETIIISLDDNKLHLFSLHQAIKKAQEKVKHHNASQKSLLEALFNLRKEEQKYE